MNKHTNPTDKNFTVLLLQNGRINIKGPDGQTVIDQGVLDTDEIFASESTISDTLTIGSGGEIEGDNFTISRSGLHIDSGANFDIVLGSGGEITNAGGDFSIDDDGLILQGSTSSYDVKRAVSWDYSFASNVFSLWYNGLANSGVIESTGSILLDSNNVDIGRDLEMGRLLRLYRNTSTGIKNLSSPQEGDIAYSTTINDPVFYDGSNWRSIIDNDTI